jgi:hypothetical protein
MSKYIKLIEIVVMQVFGSTEDERYFNTLSFIKDKVKNWLTVLSVSSPVFSHKPYVASSCTSVGLIQICQGLFPHCHFPNKYKQ